MADVISSPRGPTSVDEPQLRNNAVGRTRRRKTTDEVIEEMDSLEPYDRRAEDRTPADAADEQREKELKKDCGECSPSYRYGDDDTVAPLSCNQDAIVPIETDPLVQVVQVVATADVTMEPQPAGSAIAADERCDDGVAQSVAEGQPVAPVVEAELSEQLRNLSPPAGANGDSLIVVEHAAAIINLHSGGYPLPEPTEPPPMMPPPMVNETERSETDQQSPVALLDTSRHSWHCCDNETHPM
uniref:Uncharacterized protein n=1 Tax=Anopheles melas TaxID=34690 RepID=A0A182TPQ9_9DIPT